MRGHERELTDDSRQPAKYGEQNVDQEIRPATRL